MFIIIMIDRHRNKCYRQNNQHFPKSSLDTPLHRHENIINDKRKSKSENRCSCDFQRQFRDTNDQCDCWILCFDGMTVAAAAAAVIVFRCFFSFFLFSLLIHTHTLSLCNFYTRFSNLLRFRLTKIFFFIASHVACCFMQSASRDIEDDQVLTAFVSV